VSGAAELIVVGTSLGGLHALEKLLSSLPPAFPLPLAVVQHRSPEESQLAALLQEHCALPVAEVNDKDRVVAGRVYLAPADYHLLVDAGRFALSTDQRVLHARPSIDVLFASAADAYRDRLIGVVLTGASSDGTHGALRIKQRGGRVVAQDPATAEAPLMPRAAIEAGCVDEVLTLDDIGFYLGRAASDAYQP
jgi:two-component system, chemotaxis family, protein-glutamate methylesterase/glutaminase